MGATYFKGLFTKLIPSSGIEFSDGRIKTYASGSPEGVITATVGSEYTDTSSGILYQKRSGSGNTGWLATISLTEMATGSMSAPGLPFVGDANTGIFQPNVNRLGITTDGQERFMVDENGRLYNVYDGDVGTNYRTTLHAGWMCRAWVNFDGTGGVHARGSGNVSTISDHGTGWYTVNFTVALPDAEYSANTNGSDYVNNYSAPGEIISRLAASLQFQTKYNPTATNKDMPEVHVSVHR